MTHVPTPTLPGKPEAVYFFGTCLMDVFYGEAGLAAVELIEREGVRVIFPQAQTCCGQPPFNSGYRDEARRVAAAELPHFARPLPVVVPSGSCGAMMRVHYPHLFPPGDPLAEQARDLAGRVFEWSEFLVHGLGVRWEDRGEPVKVAYHPSCHLKRELGAADAPLALLRQLRNVELVEFRRPDECCGFGGTFSVKQEPLSAAMAGDKARAVVSSGAQVLVSADGGCLMNIGGALGRGGSSVRVLPLALFLKERVHAA